MATSTHVRQPWLAGSPATQAGYDRDVILWSQEQARLLRARRFSELDIERLAEEIEHMGRSEKRDLADRMAALSAHLLAWRSQPESRTSRLRAVIADERRRIALTLKETPSLRAAMRDRDWQDCVWLDARAHARREAAVRDDALPDACPWTMVQAVEADFWPAAPKPQPFAVGLAARSPG